MSIVELYGVSYNHAGMVAYFLAKRVLMLKSLANLLVNE